MRIVRACAGAGVLLLLAGGPAAPKAMAAQSGRITVAAFGGFSAGRLYWATQGGCSTAARDLVNGTDVAIFSLSGYAAGTVVTVSWSGTAAPSGRLSPQVYTAACAPVATPASGGEAPGTPLRVTVGPGARWLAVDGTLVANATLTLAP